MDEKFQLENIPQQNDAEYYFSNLEKDQKIPSDLDESDFKVIEIHPINLVCLKKDGLECRIAL